MVEDKDFAVEAGKFSYGFFKSFLNQEIDKLENFFSQNKVGFLPEGCSYDNIRKAQKKTSFKQLKYLIGNHETIPIVSIGIWINSLPEEEQKKIAEDTRDEVYKEYKRKGVSILNMAATGFMEAFIGQLTSYSIRKDISKEELIDIYEQALEDWEKITFFVQKTQSKEMIATTIQSKLSQGAAFIYVFASYSAIQTTREAISGLEKESIIEQFRYQLYEERLEPLNNKIVWTFEKNNQN